MLPAASAGPSFHDGHVDREVPRHDQAADPDRLAQREVEAGRADRDRLAEELVGGAGVVVEDEADGERLAARALDGLADVGRLQLGQLLEVGLDQAGVLGQRPAALGGGPGGPALRVLERLLGGLHRPVHVLRPAERRGGDHLPGGRVDHVEGLPVGGVDLLAADDHLHVARGSDGLRFRSHAPILGAWRGRGRRGHCPRTQPVGDRTNEHCLRCRSPSGRVNRPTSRRRQAVAWSYHPWAE